MWRRGEPVLWHQFQDGAVDEWGDPAPGYGAPVEVGNVAVAKTSTAEPAEDGSLRVSLDTTLYFSPPLVAGPRDRFTVRGELYEVQAGSPLDEWRNPYTGETPGSEVKVRRVTG